MATTLTIRDVPDDLKLELAAEADRRGQSLQAYLLHLLEEEKQILRNGLILAEVDQGLEEMGAADRAEVDVVEMLARVRAERDRELETPTD